MKRFGIITGCIAAILAVGLSAYFVLAQEKHNHSAELRPDTSQGKALDSATVSFGGWMTTPPLDRFPNENPRTANHHALTPKTVKIKAGGTVNFIIGGFHQVLVYDDGTQPADINTNLTVQPTNLPTGPPLINDPTRRIYRGLDPSTQSQDRVEVVVFDRPGTYLVMCAVRPHFVNDGMYAFVRVLPNGNDDDDAQK
jgi:plastocyanin